MNLWFRLFYVLITGPWRERLVLPDGKSILRFRVWPFDLDTSLHMNNGRYLTLMDLGRLDVMISTGLLTTAAKKGWTPIASKIAIRFRRELRLFQKIRLVSRILCWSDTLVVMEQIFVFDGGERDGQIAARALFKGGLYDRKARAFVTTERLMQEAGVTVRSPPIPDEVKAFLETDDLMREIDKSEN